jgi:O-antigen/teichoic acid export membrane protein
VSTVPLEAAPPPGVLHRARFLHMFSSAVLSQAVLSAASLLVGLLLIRRSSDAQYGAYVLVFNGFLLLTALQSAFFNPSMVIRMTPLDAQGRGEIVGGLFREQLRLLRPLVWLGLATIGALRVAGRIDNATTLLLLLAVAAARATLNREYFRTALLAHRRSHDVLRGDALYVLLLLAGAATATLLPLAAAATVAALGLAAVVAGRWLSGQLKREEAWNVDGAPGILAEIAPGALWTTAGAAIHWLFSQGYSYLIAATLDLGAVAAVAATRLLLMPINLVSTGVCSLMLPVTAGWLQELGVRAVFRRLLLFAAVLVAGAGCYMVAMWLARDWIFGHVFQKQFAQRDLLLLLWSIVALLMVLRDQLLYLLLARSRFRQLSVLTAASAALSLAVTWFGMLAYGVPGALLGVMAGELLSVVGIVALSLRETAPPAAERIARPPF